MRKDGAIMLYESAVNMTGWLIIKNQHTNLKFSVNVLERDNWVIRIHDTNDDCIGEWGRCDYDNFKSMYSVVREGKLL